MKKMKTAKMLSLLMALMLLLQLLPLGTAMAAEGAADAGEAVEALPGDGLGEGSGAPLEGEDPDLDAGPDGTLNTEASGAKMALMDGGGAGLIPPDQVIIHKKTDTHPTDIIITKPDTTRIYPDSNGNYQDVPADATIVFKLGFSLLDGNGDESKPEIYT